MAKVWAQGSSTMVRRQLGRRLRELRVAARKTQEDVAATKLMSLGKLKLIEHGRTSVRPGDVYELCQLYGADDAVTAELRTLATATTQAGWWLEYTGGLVKGFETYLDLESSAAVLSIYHPLVIHGLFQTEDYARGVDEVTSNPAWGPEVIRRNVQLRLQRLPSLLKRDDPPRIEAILGETAFQVRVGGDDVMRAQCEHLREIAAQDRITIRVLTHASGPNLGMLGAFTLLDFDDEEDPSVAFVETYAGARYDDQEGPVARHREVLASLRAQSVLLEDFLA